MLPKGQRLTKKSDFVFIFKKGRKILGKYVILRYVFKNDQAESRWAAVASLKVSKKAIIRNLLKRRVRKALSEVKTAKPIDGIIYINSAAKDCDYQELQQDIQQVVKQIK